MYRGKRYFALVLGLVFLFGACGMRQEGTGVPETTNVPTEYPVATVAPTTEPTMTVAPTDAPKREEFFDDNPTGIPRVTQESVVTVAPIETNPSTTPEPMSEELPKLEGTFVADENGVVVDNEWYSVKIVSLEENEQSEYVLCVRFENKSDRRFCFCTENHVVNGVDVICPWARSEVEPGEYVTEKFVYEYEDLARCSVADITGIMFELEIQDRSSIPYCPIGTCNVYCYPQGENAYVPYQHVMEEGDVFIGEDEGFKMIVTDVHYDETWGYVLEAYFENKLEYPITVHLDDVFINGFQLEPWRYRTYTLGANRSAYEEFNLGYYVWDAFRIQEITELCFSVAVWSEEGLQYAVWDEPFTLYPLGEDVVKSYEFVPEEDDITVFDTEECRVVVTEVETVYGDSVVTVYFENKAEKKLRFVCDGFWGDSWSEWESWYSDEFWYADVEAGRCMVTKLEVSEGNVKETENGVMHSLGVAVSYEEENEEIVLIQEEVELWVQNIEE